MWLHPQFRCDVKHLEWLEECPICLEDRMASVVMLGECGHRFCDICAKVCNACAICRAPVPESESRLILHVGGSRAHSLLDSSRFVDQIWVVVPTADTPLSGVIFHLLWQRFGAVDTVFAGFKVSESFDPIKEAKVACRGFLGTKDTLASAGAHFLVANVDVRGKSLSCFLDTTGREILNAILVSLDGFEIRRVCELFRERWKMEEGAVRGLITSMLDQQDFCRGCELRVISGQEWIVKM